MLCSVQQQSPARLNDFHERENHASYRCLCFHAQYAFGAGLVQVASHFRRHSIATSGPNVRHLEDGSVSQARCIPWSKALGETRKDD